MASEITAADNKYVFRSVPSCIEILDNSKEKKNQTHVVITSKTLCRGCGVTEEKCPMWCKVLRFIAIVALFSFSLVANWTNCNLQYENFPWDRYYAAADYDDDAYEERLTTNTTTEADLFSPIYYASDSPRMRGIGWFTNYDISTVMALKAFCILLTFLYITELFVMYIGGRYVKPDKDYKAICFLRCHFSQILLTLLFGDFAISIINYRLAGIGPGGSCQLRILQYPNDLNTAHFVAMFGTFLVLLKQLILSLFIILAPLLGNTCCCRWARNIPGEYYFDFRKSKEEIFNPRYRFYHTLVILFVVLISGYFCVGTIVKIVGSTEHAKVMLHYRIHHTSGNSDEISRHSLHITTLGDVIQAGDDGFDYSIPCQSLHPNSDVTKPVCSPANCSLEIKVLYNKQYKVFSNIKKAPVHVDGSFWSCQNSAGDPEYFYTGHEVWLSYYDTCNHVCDSFNITHTVSDIDYYQCV
ncbi:uncharacterized protein LOC144437821 [Glandiceps talaboti]